MARWPTVAQCGPNLRPSPGPRRSSAAQRVSLSLASFVSSPPSRRRKASYHVPLGGKSSTTSPSEFLSSALSLLVCVLVVARHPPEAQAQSDQPLPQSDGSSSSSSSSSRSEQQGVPSLEQCTLKLNEFVEREMQSVTRPSRPDRGAAVSVEKQDLRTLLFFLHVPRTGGRTYHQCFLKALYPPQMRCPRSYDMLRFDPSKPECRLLASHLDYSLMTRLPAANVSVASNIRHPVDRLLSAYEFTLETASRSLRWLPKIPEGQTMIQALRAVREKMKGRQSSETRRVWPWSLLVPMMEDDLWSRRKVPGVPEPPSGKEELSSYNKSYLVMPLSDFIEHPFVSDLLHNGATFQVTGITENSCFDNAPTLRHCAMAYPEAAKVLLKLAKARVSAMLHVGLTEVHQESAELFAATIGRSLSSVAYTGPDPHSKMMKRWSKMKGPNADAFRLAFNASRMTLLQHYKRCVDMQRNRYAMRRRMSTKLLGPISFSHESRQEIPLALIRRIRELNWLDIELLDHARQVFKAIEQMHSGALKAIKAEEEEAMGRRPDDPTWQREQQLEQLQKQREHGGGGGKRRRLLPIQRIWRHFLGAPREDGEPVPGDLRMGNEGKLGWQGWGWWGAWGGGKRRGQEASRVGEVGKSVRAERVRLSERLAAKRFQSQGVRRVGSTGGSSSRSDGDSSSSSWSEDRPLRRGRGGEVSAAAISVPINGISGSYTAHQKEVVAVSRDVSHDPYDNGDDDMCLADDSTNSK